MSNTYNGWTNRQTWYVYFTYQDLFENVSKTSRFDDALHMQYVFELMICDRALESLKEDSVAYEATVQYLEAVNWMEIVEAYFVPEDSERMLAITSGLN